MKANRSAASASRRFRDDERGVSEAVGYVITFGISTIILVTSLLAFNAIRDYTRDLSVDRALRELGGQVAFAVEEAIRAGATYPDTTFTMRLEIPRDIQGEGYRIILEPDEVAMIAVEASGEELNLTGEELNVRGRYYADFVERVGVVVHCVDAYTVIPEGTCLVNSEEGQITVTYRDPPGPLPAGVYFTS